MARHAKPYDRAEPLRKAKPDASGSWKHDLHTTVRQSLASRLSIPSSRPSLLNRISGGQGKELLPGDSAPRLHGFDERAPVNPTWPNSGLELLPSGNGVGRPRKSVVRGVTEPGQRSLLDAALGQGRVRQEVRRPVQIQSQGQIQVESVSIMGAARGTTWVRVEHLALGTTAEDVVSAFAPVPILTASVSSSPNHPTVSVDLEFAQRSSADEVIRRYHGAVADGNTLSVTVIRPALSERLGRVTSPPVLAPAPARPQELISSRSSSKMYSDTILASNPRSAIITLAADNPAPERAQRADAWLMGGPSLAQRVGKSRGRGQIGGGSYADMMVD